MTNSRTAAPAGLNVARWYLAAVAVIVLGIAAVTILSHVGAAMSGTTLVFSQEGMRTGGAIGPIPGGEATGSMQYVDVTSLVLTVAVGAALAAGAIALFRRSRWFMPLGLLASAVAAGIGLVPAAIGLWAMDFYALVDLAAVAPLLVISALLVFAAMLCALAIWRARHAVAAV